MALIRSAVIPRLRAVMRSLSTGQAPAPAFHKNSVVMHTETIWTGGKNFIGVLIKETCLWKLVCLRVCVR